MLQSCQGTVRVRSWHLWQTQGTLSEIFDFLTWFSTRSLSLERRLSFRLWTQCLCTAQPTSHVRAARENIKRDSSTKFRDPGSQFESPSDPQHKHNGVCGFVGEVVQRQHDKNAAPLHLNEWPSFQYLLRGPGEHKTPFTKVFWQWSEAVVECLTHSCNFTLQTMLLYFSLKKTKNLWRSPILQ